MKSTITDIYKGYFQKSRVFLYPILGIARGSFDPMSTFISWEGQVSLGDMKLLCRYHNRQDVEFQMFEERRLLGNTFFEDCVELEDGTLVYTFDMSDFSEDWFNFIAGKYSQLSGDVKKHIRDHYQVNSPNYAFIHTYLYPEDYYDLYAGFLSTTEEDKESIKECIIKTGELCDKPNFQKEELKIPIKVLERKKI